MSFANSSMFLRPHACVALSSLTLTSIQFTYRFAAGTLLRRKRKREQISMAEEDSEEETSLELHLTPLHGISQLRPSYEYLGELEG